MKYFLFDKAQKYVTRINTEYLIEAHYTEEINTAGQLEFTLPATMRLPKNVFYVCVTDPDDERSYLMFKIVTEKVTDEKVTYTCIENAYDELASYTYIKDKRPTAIASAMLQMVLGGTRWSVGSCPEVSPKFCSFYYISVLEAIQKIVNLWGFEVQFKVKIDGITNEIKQRNINLYTKLGKRTNKRFEYGSNLLSVTQANDSTGLYTALVGRGKGVQVSEGDTDTDPDGYGRRITFADVVWSTQNGNPLNKPAGQEYLEDPNATAAYGFPDGHPRIGFVTFQDCEDPNELIQLTYDKLQEVNHPQVQFSASIADVGSLDLGDTIAIVRHDIGIEYYTRVFKVVHDLLDSSNNTVELGDNIAGSNSITQQISNIQNNQSNVQNAIDTIVMNGADGNKLFFGTDFPANGTDGDIFYKTLENGGTEMYIYKDGGWQLVVSTEELDAVQKQVDEQTSQIQQAVQDANAASTKADSLVAQVGDANTNAQKALTTAQQNRADLAQAKNDLENTKNQLTNVQSDLTSTKSSLAGAISNISQAQEDLKNTEQGLQGVKSDLANTKQSLANDEKNLTSLSEQAKVQGQSIVNIHNTQAGLAADIADVKGNVSSLQATADGLQATVGTLNSDNLLYNSDFMANTPGKAPNTDWLPVPGWLSLNNTAVQRCMWSGYSTLQVGWINANGGFYTKAVKSNTPDPKNANATTAYDLSFLIMSQPGTYDVYIEASYTEDFSVPKQIKLGTINQCQNWTPQEYSFTVPSVYPWLRLKMVSEQNKGLFYLAQPMLVYGSKKPSSYISSNQPSQKITSISETVDGIKTAVTDNTNGISQIKQTAQSIQSDVANNKNDISSIKQTADSLKSSIQDDEKNISSLQQTAQGLQGSISNNKNDIANIKATAQGLQTSVQDNKKNISTIQQQAGTIESAISTVNSDNLIYNSDFLTTEPGISPLTDWKPADGWNPINTAVQRCMWFGYSALQVGWISANAGMYTRAIKANQPNTSDTSAKTKYNLSFLIRTSAGAYDVYIDCSYDDTFNNSTAVKVDTITQTYSNWTKLNWTVELPSIYPWIRLRIISEQDKGLFYLAQPMLVYGADTPSKYISSNQPGQKMSSIKQTIDSLSSKIADADGNISQLKQTSDSLTSQIGNANNDISSLKQRADSMETNISNNQNDISSLKQTANSLQSNVQSKADISQITQLSNAIQSVVQNVGTIFPNGDFADSNIQAYWSPWDTTKDYTNITFDAATYNGSFGNLMLHTTYGGWTKAISTEYIPVQPSKSVTVSLASRGDWYGSNGKPQTLQCYVHFYDSKKNETASGSFDLNCSNNQQWYDNSAGYDCASNECYVRIEIILQGNQENWAHITNVKVSSDGGESISSKISQMADDINMRVQKGDLLSQINIQAGKTLIQSNKLYLDASSVVFSGSAFIPSAAITDLSADKITTGTLNAANVHVINMDIANLVGDKTSFVRSQWQNAYGAYVNIDGSGMSVGYGNWFTKFDGLGMTFKDGGDDLGGFTRVGMVGAPSWYGGLAFNAGGDAEFLSIGAKDYHNDNQNPVPSKLLWARQGIDTYGYKPGWNFGDDVWTSKIGINSIQYGSWNIHFGIVVGDNNFSALTLTSGSGNGFYWGSDGSFGYVTGGNALHNVKGSQIVYSIGSDGTCHSWGGV